MVGGRHLDPDATLFDLDWKTWMLQLVAVLISAVGDIELPSVPRASHDAAPQRSLAQRPAVVGAGPLHRPIFSIDTKQRDNLTGDDHLRH